jgi:thiol-disulfide isomerase/thioredoxin
MRYIFGFLIILTSVLHGYAQSAHKLKVGTWRGVLELQGQQLPFNFRVTKDATGGFDVFLKNAKEELLLDEVNFKNDSVDFVLHVFDAQLRASIKGDSLKGFFILNYRNDYRLPFKAAFNQNFRFSADEKKPKIDFSGKYQVVFTNAKDTTLGVGLITQKGTYAEGTFLTPTGDYRFLEGNVINDTLHLSTFDGNHAYLFKAYFKNDFTLQGDYWAGKSYHQNWTGVKNENASLPNPESLTYLKDGYDKIEFSFPDLNGNKVTLNDFKYENKVVILQLFGSWCPNCMDETKFLSEWYNVNKDRGVEVLGLAYERKEDFAYASDRVKKVKEKWNVKYDFVIGGVNDKVKAAQTLPALNKVVAFPTTIFIGKDGKVRHIHTGFEGPGTGVYFLQFVDRFNEIVNELLAEEMALKNIKK